MAEWQGARAEPTGAAEPDDVLTLAVGASLASGYARALEDMAQAARTAAKECDGDDRETRLRCVARLDEVGMLRGQLTRTDADGNTSLTGRRSLLREAAFLAATSAIESLDQAVEVLGSRGEGTVDEARLGRLLGNSEACFAAVGMLSAVQRTAPGEPNRESPEHECPSRSTGAPMPNS